MGAPMAADIAIRRSRNRSVRSFEDCPSQSRDRCQTGLAVSPASSICLGPAELSRLSFDNRHKANWSQGANHHEITGEGGLPIGRHKTSLLFAPPQKILWTTITSPSTAELAAMNRRLESPAHGPSPGTYVGHPTRFAKPVLGRRRRAPTPADCSRNGIAGPQTAMHQGAPSAFDALILSPQVISATTPELICLALAKVAIAVRGH